MCETTEIQPREILFGSTKCIQQVGDCTVSVNINFTYRYDASRGGNVVTGVTGGSVTNIKGFSKITNAKVPNGAIYYTNNDLTVHVPYSFYGTNSQGSRYYGSVTFVKL